MTDLITDGILQRQLMLQRVVTNIMKEDIAPAYRKSYKEIRLVLLDEGEIKSKRQLDRIEREIKRIIQGNSGIAWKAITANYEEIAGIEAGELGKALSTATGAAVTVAAVDQAVKQVNKTMMKLEGNRPRVDLWDDFVIDNIDSQAKMAVGAVKAGYQGSRTVQETVNDVKRVTIGVSSRDAEALARTGINHYARVARDATAKQNLDIIDREVPVVTFDNRISATCASIGSKYGVTGWPYGQSPIGYNPFHFGCRTTITYLVNGQKRLEGTRAATGGRGRSGDIDRPTYKGKSDIDIFTPKQISAPTNINDFMRDQPVWWQESNLGVTRAKLLRDGVDLDKFTDSIGRPLTIKQMIKDNKKIAMLLKD